MISIVQQRRQKLAQLKAQHQYRQCSISDSPQQREMLINGKKVLNFAGNNYLGLANHPKIRQAFIEGVKKWGTGSGAAHLINGHSKAHQQLEEELAEFTGRSRALLFSSGYMANLAILGALYDKQFTLFSDKLNHASLIDASLACTASKKRFRHTDPKHLQQLWQKADTPYRAIISDAVFSMDGDIAPLRDYLQLITPGQDEMMIDDAHGFGVLGKQGAGTCQHFGLSQQQVPVYMATLGKAAGCSGAFVAASEEVIESIINFGRSYIFTTASPPALAEACRQSIQLIKSESWRREKLQQNIHFFQQYSRQLGLSILDSVTAIQGVIITENKKLLQIKEQLFNQGFLVAAIRPPTVPQGTSRLRITLSCDHKTQQIQLLLDILDRLR